MILLIGGQFVRIVNRNERLEKMQAGMPDFFSGLFLLGGTGNGTDKTEA
jgi:hypothetical protein